MMGFAWGVGGLTVPFVGMLADRIGIEHTLMAMSGVPLAAAALAWPLPAGARGAVRPSPSEISTIERAPALRHYSGRPEQKSRGADIAD